jgi:hypothetical protein
MFGSTLPGDWQPFHIGVSKDIARFGVIVSGGRNPAQAWDCYVPERRGTRTRWVAVMSLSWGRRSFSDWGAERSPSLEQRALSLREAARSLYQVGDVLSPLEGQSRGFGPRTTLAG